MKYNGTWNYGVENIKYNRQMEVQTEKKKYKNIKQQNSFA